MDGPIICAEVLVDKLVCKASALARSCRKKFCSEDIEGHSGCIATTAVCPSVPDDSSIPEKDELIAQVLGMALNGILHIHDTHESLPGSNPCSNEVLSSQSEVQFSIGATVDSMDDSGNSLCESGSLLHSQLLVLEQEELASLQSEGRICREEEAYCVTPLSTYVTTPTELVSALKGGRERQGMLPIGKLSVKWVPEVYDPPVTSASHTVTGNHHRSKGRKDHHKHKYIKGRSSRGSSSSNKKHPKTRRNTYSTSDSRIMRCQAPTVDKFNMKALDQQNAELMEFGVVGHELMCGSGCYSETPATITKAS